MPHFAANLTMMFNELPFLDRFAAAASAGFDAVEFLFPYDHEPEVIKQRADDAGVDIVLFNMPPGDWAAGERGIAVFPERRAEFVQYLTKAILYARVLDVPRLHMMAGIADAIDAGVEERYCDSLLLASEACNAAGLDVLIEPLNRRDMPGYFLNDFAQAARIIAGLNQKNIKLQYDIYHRQILHGDVLRSLETMLPIIGHIQTASVPHRHEPGTGELDDFAIFAALDAMGYGGHVGCEYRPAGETVGGLGWLARV